MEYTASSGVSGGSYEKPKPGSYYGILIGFAELGTHTGQYGPKRRVMLRWELHKRKGPALDANGVALTVTAMYNSSFDVNSSLRHVVEAHIGPCPDGARTDSRSWLGKAARLTLKESDDGKWVNVDTVVPLDPEDDEEPKRQTGVEHWELGDDAIAPPWCKWMVDRSAERKGDAPNGVVRTTTVPAGVADDDDDDIPF